LRKPKFNTTLFELFCERLEVVGRGSIFLASRRITSGVWMLVWVLMVQWGRAVVYFPQRVVQLGARLVVMVR
jgi:hypothetical protein